MRECDKSRPFDARRNPAKTRLADYVGTGKLRSKLEGDMPADALELLIDVLGNYLTTQRRRTK